MVQILEAVDYTAIPTTAAHALAQAQKAGRLNDLDYDQYVVAVDNIVKPFVGRGFSPMNYKKLMQIIRRGDLQKAQFGLMQWLLAATGNRVVENTDELTALSTMITESNHSISDTKAMLIEWFRERGYGIAPLNAR